MAQKSQRGKFKLSARSAEGQRGVMPRPDEDVVAYLQSEEGAERLGFGC